MTLPDRHARSPRTSQQRSWPGHRSGRVQVVAIPREHTLDSSLALLKEGYTFIGNRCQRFGSNFSLQLYLYVNRASLERPEVQAFLHFTFDHIDDVVRTVQYVPLAEADYTANRDALKTLAP